MEFICTVVHPFHGSFRWCLSWGVTWVLPAMSLFVCDKSDSWDQNEHGCGLVDWFLLLLCMSLFIPPPAGWCEVARVSSVSSYGVTLCPFAPGCGFRWRVLQNSFSPLSWCGWQFSVSVVLFPPPSGRASQLVWPPGSPTAGFPAWLRLYWSSHPLCWRVRCSPVVLWCWRSVSVSVACLWEVVVKWV